LVLVASTTAQSLEELAGPGVQAAAADQTLPVELLRALAVWVSRGRVKMAATHFALHIVAAAVALDKLVLMQIQQKVVMVDLDLLLQLLAPVLHAQEEEGVDPRGQQRELEALAVGPMVHLGTLAQDRKSVV
jgi:hypothetical protein